MLSYPKWVLFLVCSSVVMTIFVGFIDSTLGSPDTAVIGQMQSLNPVTIVGTLKDFAFWDFAWLTTPWDVVVWPFQATNLVFIALLTWEVVSTGAGWLAKLFGR